MKKNYKNFICYLYNDHKVKSLHIMLPKINAYVKIYDRQTKWMFFFIEDEDILEKYNTIWDNVTPDIKKHWIASLSITSSFWKPK